MGTLTQEPPTRMLLSLDDIASLLTLLYSCYSVSCFTFNIVKLIWAERAPRAEGERT